MIERLCCVTIADGNGGGHAVEVSASSLRCHSAAVKTGRGHIAMDGFMPSRFLSRFCPRNMTSNERDLILAMAHRVNPRNANAGGPEIANQ
jgi:hypothetical protein